ncbi:MAG: aromatic-ring-hydroxylating dioxygenase subunit beta [Casimicrobiaceae bacterium]
MDAITSELRVAVADLNAEYAACLDDRRFDEWPDLFTDDCVYRLQPRENYDRGLPLATMACESKGMLKDRIFAATQTLFHIPYSTRHIVGWPRVALGNDGHIEAESNYTVVRVRENELPELFSAGRYIDRIVRVEGQLKFRQRLCIFDNALIANSIIYPI